MSKFLETVSKEDVGDIGVQEARKGVMCLFRKLYKYGEVLEQSKEATTAERGKTYKRLAEGYWEEEYKSLPENRKDEAGRVEREQSIWQKLKGSKDD